MIYEDSMMIDGKEFRKYDNIYYISMDGEIYSTHSNKFLKHVLDKDGYHCVCLHGYKNVKIHRLVYEAWIGKIPNNLQINHINDDKDNNRVTNLYAGTVKENTRDFMNNFNRFPGNFKSIAITAYEWKTGLTITFPSILELRNYGKLGYGGYSSNDILNIPKFYNNFSFISAETITDVTRYKEIQKNYYNTINHNIKRLIDPIVYY